MPTLSPTGLWKPQEGTSRIDAIVEVANHHQVLPTRTFPAPDMKIHTTPPPGKAAPIQSCMLRH